MGEGWAPQSQGRGGRIHTLHEPRSLSAAFSGYKPPGAPSDPTRMLSREMRKKTAYFAAMLTHRTFAGQGTLSSVAHLLLRTWGRRSAAQLCSTHRQRAHLTGLKTRVRVEEMTLGVKSSLQEHEGLSLDP